jgi:hypothetical protein
MNTDCTDRADPRQAMIFHSKQSRLIVLSGLLILCIGFALTITFEKQIVDYLMPTKGWVRFDVPREARQIRASVKESSAGLNICNEDAVAWTDITVKVMGIYDAAYLARPKSIRAGTCEYVPFSDFAEPSWKHMQMPPTETLVKFELIVKSGAGGYASLPLVQK